MSEFYIQLVTRSGRKDLLDQYLSWVEYWSERLMCPEGISCYDNDPSVDFDNWNSRLGTWHGYSIRGFYNAVVHACFGVNFDEDGLHILPSPADEGTELCNLHFGKKSFDIRLIGEGGAIREVKLNGRSLGAVSHITFGDLSEYNRIEILRG